MREEIMRDRQEPSIEELGKQKSEAMKQMGEEYVHTESRGAQIPDDARPRTTLDRKIAQAEMHIVEHKIGKHLEYGEKANFVVRGRNITLMRQDPQTPEGEKPVMAVYIDGVASNMDELQRIVERENSEFMDRMYEEIKKIEKEREKAREKEHQKEQAKAEKREKEKEEKRQRKKSKKEVQWSKE